MSVMHHRAPEARLGGKGSEAHDDQTTLAQDTRANNDRTKIIAAWTALGAVGLGSALYFTLRSSGTSEHEATGSVPATAGAKPGTPAGNSGSSHETGLFATPKDPCTAIPRTIPAAVLGMSVETAGLSTMAQDPGYADLYVQTAAGNAADCLFEGNAGSGAPALEVAVSPAAAYSDTSVISGQKLPVVTITTANGAYPGAFNADTSSLDVQVGDGSSGYDVSLTYVQDPGAQLSDAQLESRLTAAASGVVSAVIGG